MSKVNVFNHAWIDLVFEGRNQSYGAYQLRRQDSKTTALALITGIGLMVSVAIIPLAVNYFSPAEVITAKAETTTYIEVETIDEPVYVEPAKPEPIIEQPAAPAPVVTAPTAPTTRFTELVATEHPVEAPPTINDVLATNPGQVTSAGEPGGIVTAPPTNGVPGGTGTNTTITTGTGFETTASVDVMPSYPGGMKKFYEEVGKKFRVPSLDNASTLKVYVSFIVETDGRMTNIKVMRDPGYELGKEAIRVLQSIKTKWEPGMKKGVPVRTDYNLTIIVKVN